MVSELRSYRSIVVLRQSSKSAAEQQYLGWFDALIRKAEAMLR